MKRSNGNTPQGNPRTTLQSTTPRPHPARPGLAPLTPTERELDMHKHYLDQQKTMPSPSPLTWGRSPKEAHPTLQASSPSPLNVGRSPKETHPTLQASSPGTLNFGRSPKETPPNHLGRPRGTSNPTPPVNPTVPEKPRTSSNVPIRYPLILRIEKPRTDIHPTNNERVSRANHDENHIQASTLPKRPSFIAPPIGENIRRKSQNNILPTNTNKPMDTPSSKENASRRLQEMQNQPRSRESNNQRGPLPPNHQNNQNREPNHHARPRETGHPNGSHLREANKQPMESNTRPVTDNNNQREARHPNTPQNQPNPTENNQRRSTNQDPDATYQVNKMLEILSKLVDKIGPSVSQDANFQELEKKLKEIPKGSKEVVKEKEKEIARNDRNILNNERKGTLQRKPKPIDIQSTPKRPTSCKNCMCGTTQIGKGRTVSKHWDNCNIFLQYEHFPFCPCGKSLPTIRREIQDTPKNNHEANDILKDHKRKCSKSKALILTISGNIDEMDCYESYFKQNQEMLEEQEMNLCDWLDFGKQKKCLLCGGAAARYTHFDVCAKKKAVICCFMMSFVNHHFQAVHAPSPFSSDNFYEVLGI